MINLEELHSGLKPSKYIVPTLKNQSTLKNHLEKSPTLRNHPKTKSPSDVTIMYCNILQLEKNVSSVGYILSHRKIQAARYDLDHFKYQITRERKRNLTIALCILNIFW